MAKKEKMTLEMLATHMDQRFEKLETIIERGFAATADDIADMKEEMAGLATKEDLAKVEHAMATKEQMFALQTQVNSIEGQLRQQGRLEVRVGDLEEKVFGEARA